MKNLKAVDIIEINSDQIQCIAIKFQAKIITKIQTGGKNQIQIACLESTFSEIVSINTIKTGKIVHKINAIM